MVRLLRDAVLHPTREVLRREVVRPPERYAAEALQNCADEDSLRAFHRTDRSQTL